MEWKWSNGISYKKSKRPTKNDVTEEDKQSYLQDENEIFSKNIEESAYSTSLNHDENTWDILNQGFLKQSSKREDLDNKIADRELVQQKGFNPFLIDSNYVQDISNSDMFLKPVNTTQEREKNKTNNE
jgi:hypothetical protein